MDLTFAALRACAAAAVLAMAVPASAQEWDQPWADPLDRPGRFDISVSAGVLAPTDWSDLVLLGTISPAFGILEQVLVQNVRVEPDTKFAGSVTYWRGRYGFRTDVGYSNSVLTLGGEPLGLGGGTVDVRTWVYGVRGTIGLIEYSPRRWVWPYAFLGLGGITYDLAQPISPPLLTFIEHGPPANGRPQLIVAEDTGRTFLLQVNELTLETTLAFSLGVGTDLRIPVGPGGVGLRLEVTDHIARSPLQVRIHELGPLGHETHVGFGAVHHLRASAGIVVHFGR
jgi:hypothetical protein